MPLLASSILDEAAVLLDDPDKDTYDNDALLPMLKRAYDNLERQLILYNSNKVKKTSPDITVNGNEIDVTDRSDSVLDDLIEVRDIYRKNPATGKYIKIYNFDTIRVSSDDILDNLTDTSSFYWVFEGGIIRLNKTAVDEVFKIVYSSQLRYTNAETKLLSATSPVVFPSFTDYLTKLTAAYAAQFLMENPTRSAELHALSRMAFDDLKGSEVKQNQKRAVRWRSFSRRNRGRRRFALGIGD